MATRTILVALTWDGRNIIVTPHGTVTPVVIVPEHAHEQLRELATDETIEVAKTQSSGFDVGDFFKGMGKLVADMGRDGAGEGEQR